MATGRKYKLRTDSTCIQVQTQVSGAVRQQKAAQAPLQKTSCTGILEY